MDDISRLRKLLGITEDRAASEQVQARVVDPGQRTEDVAEVLPRALEVARQDGRLAAALKQPIEDTLQTAIEENPRSIAEVLYPVMGPAIRRSIAETLSAALEGLNQGLQLGFSRQGIKWRLESWRTGVPFREVVLRHTLRYRVSEAYLINKDNGLLIARVGVIDDDAMDRDAVAAMLTAIEDFVADSTGSSGDEGELSSASLGGKALWILQGYAARLALVIEGQPPLSLRLELQDRLAWMHEHFGAFMHEYSGAEEAPAALEEELANCLGFESAEDDSEASGSPWIAIIVLAILALALGGWAAWAAWQSHLAEQRWQQLRQLVDATPGLVWLDADREANRLDLLADPLAVSPAELPGKAGFEQEPPGIRQHPFLSAEPQMVLRRLETTLGPLPAEVVANTDGERLVLSGRAPAGWLQRLEGALGAQLNLVDRSALQSAGLASQLRNELSPPPTVTMTDQGPGAVRVAGEADQAWRTRARNHVGSQYPQASVDWSDLVPSEIGQLAAAAGTLSERPIPFVADTEPADPESMAALQAELTRIADLVRGCDCEVRFTAIGCADQTGTTRTNQRMRDARARYAFDLLVASGISAERIVTDSRCTGRTVRAAFIEMQVDSP